MPQALIPPAVLKVKKKLTNHCVIFIPDGDFYWMTEKSLEPLTSEKLQLLLQKVPEQFKRKHKPGPKKGPSTINEAYVATEALDFDSFVETILGRSDDEDGEDYVDEDEDEEEEEVVDEEEEDPEDEEVEEDEEADTIVNEKDVEEDGDDELPNNLITLIDQLLEHEIEPQKNGHAKKRSLDEQEPPTKRKAVTLKKEGQLTEEEKQRQLWLCRIRLQRSLIQRNQPVKPEDPSNLPPPTDQELTTARLILYRLAAFPVTVPLLRNTKIHKVLKCILREELLEYKDSYRLHEKCKQLLDKWDPVIQELRVEKLRSPLAAPVDDHINGHDLAIKKESKDVPEASENTEPSPVETSVEGW